MEPRDRARFGALLQLRVSRHRIVSLVALCAIVLRLAQGSGVCEQVSPSPVARLVNASVLSMSAFAMADLNGDGQLDLASMNRTTVAWHADNGSGALASTPRYILTGFSDLQSLAAADMDGDGTTDLAAAFGPGVQVAFNVLGTGLSWQMVELPNADPPKVLVLVDWSHTGRADVVVWGSLGANLTLFSFGPTRTVSLVAVASAPSFEDGSSASHLAIDFDLGGPTREIVALATLQSTEMSFFTRSGSTFVQSRPRLSISAHTRQLSAADVDGSGSIDLLLLNSPLVTWVSQTDGVFEPTVRTAFNLAQFIESFTTRDITGDGLVELVVLISPAYSLYVVVNQGGGLFDPTPRLLASSFAFSLNVPHNMQVVDWPSSERPSVLALDATGILTAADLFGGSVLFTPANRVTRTLVYYAVVFDCDNDGHVDLALGGSYSVDLVRSIESSSFADAMRLTTDGELLVGVGLLALDLNSDGLADLVIANNLRVSWLANLGDANFAARAQVTGLSTNLRLAAGADVDNDASVDLVFTWSSSSTVSWLRNSANGSGVFEQTQRTLVTFGTGVVFSFFVALPGDLDGDRLFDVVVVSGYPAQVRWFRNLGGAQFNTTGQLVGTALLSASWAPNVEDINGDGRPDILLSDGSVLHVYLNRGSGGSGGSLAFEPLAAQSFAIFSTAIVLADLDNSGTLDLITAGNSFVWQSNNGSGYFGAAQVVHASTLPPETAALGDLNNDGTLDFILPTYDGVLPVYTLLPVRTIGELQRPLAQPICSGALGTPACLVAQINAASSLCRTGSLSLGADVRGCFVTPMQLGAVAPFKLVGNAHASRWLCGAGAGVGRSLLSVSAGGSLALVNLELSSVAAATTAAAAAAASLVPSSPLVSVCSSVCLGSESAALTLTNVTVSNFANVGRVSRSAALDASFGAVALFGSSTLTATGCRFVRNSCQSGGAALALVGTGASARLVNTSFEANTASGAAADDVTGGGAVLLYGEQTALSIERCTFSGNLAGSGGGGALAVRGAAAALVVARSGFAGDSTVDGGSGGALLVAGSAAGATVSLADVQVTGAQAARAGGAIALLGGTGSLGATVRLSGTSLLAGNSAAFGGTLAALPESLVNTLDTQHTSQLGFGGAGLAGLIELADGVTVVDSSATFGGTIFVCAATVNMSAASLSGGSTAAIGGGFAFVCRSDATDSAGALPHAWLARPAPARDSSTPSAERYGPELAGPAASIELDSFPAVAFSGLPLGSGTATVRDAFGQRVLLETLALRTGLAVVAANAEGGDTIAVLDLASGLYSLGAAVVRARGWPGSLGDSVELLVGLSVDGELARGPGAPLALTTVVLAGCAAGTGRVSAADSNTPLVCAACLGATFASAAEAAVGGVCKQCPLNSYREVTNSSDAAPCLCSPGFTAATAAAAAAGSGDSASGAGAPGGEVACDACPAGAVCAGGTSVPVAAPGFFPDGGVFVACTPRAASCIGGGDCATGYVGRLCGACARGYYVLNTECRRCQPERVALASVALVLLALAVAGGLMWFNLARTISFRFAALSIGLMAAQMLALFGKLALDWGPFATGVFQVVSSLSLNVELTSPECSASASTDSWLMRFWFTMALPLFAALALGAVALALALGSRLSARGRLSAMNAAELRSAFGRSMWQAMTLLYMPLISRALAVFGCHRDVARRWVLADDTSRSCFDARWWRLLFTPGLVFSLGYGLAVPAALVFVLARARARHDAVTFTLRYAFAVARFRAPCWAFEAETMALKLLLVLSFVMLGSPSSRAAGGVLALGAFLVRLFVARPYARPVHLWVATVTQAAVLLVLFGGQVDSWLFRRLAVAFGVVAVLVVTVAGNAMDVWLYWREERRAALAWWAQAEQIEIKPAGDSERAVRGFDSRNVHGSVVGLPAELAFSIPSDRALDSDECSSFARSATMSVELESVANSRHAGAVPSQDERASIGRESVGRDCGASGSVASQTVNSALGAATF